MINLNTGLNLRKPYESHYNAYRRFLIANRFQNQKTLTSELKRRFSHIPQQQAYKFLNRIVPTPNLRSCAPLAELLEREVCDKANIPYVEPKQLGRSHKFRNCPECARRCYHCYLYELPWLSKCPLHKVDLIEKCPDCNQSWPKLGELKRTRCLTCGTHLYLKNLRESGSLEKLRDTSSFKFIERAIHDYTGMDNGTTLSSEAAVNYLDSHSSIGIFDPYFPAIMSELGREYKDGFQSLDVALPKTIMKRFEILQKVKIKRTPFTYSNASKLEIRISVHERICQAAELKFGINPSKPINRFLDLGERISSLENLLKTTYKIWLSIVCECRKSNNGKAQHYGSEYFYCANVENMPLTPCIMDGIYFFEYKEYKIPGNINEMVIYATPESIQKWLYESDLWKIFRTLLFYLDSLNYVLQKHGNTCEIFRYIPQDSTPYSWNRNSYAFLQLSQNEGVCIIPENIGKISFDDIELYTVK